MPTVSALSQNDMQQMASWLKSKGFTMIQQARGRNWISFTGTAAQVQNAFGTEIHHYNVNGEMHIANATAPRIPAALSGIVVGVRGLHDFHLKPQAAKNARAALAHGPIITIPFFKVRRLRTSSRRAISPRCTTSTPSTSYSDGDRRYWRETASLPARQTSIWRISTTSVQGSDYRRSRLLKRLRQRSSHRPLQRHATFNMYAPAHGLSDPRVPSLGDMTEADLDIEWSGAVARNAQIIYVNAPAFYSGSNYLGGGIWDAWYYAVDNQNTLGESVISLSYGNCEFYDNNVLTATGQPGADEVELMKANSEGITFLNSSGDSGAAACDGPTNTSTNPPNLAVGGLAVSYPASSPEVTGVGGTALTFSRHRTSNSHLSGGTSQWY